MIRYTILMLTIGTLLACEKNDDTAPKRKELAIYQLDENSNRLFKGWVIETIKDGNNTTDSTWVENYEVALEKSNENGISITDLSQDEPSISLPHRIYPEETSLDGCAYCVAFIVDITTAYARVEVRVIQNTQTDKVTKLYSYYERTQTTDPFTRVTTFDLTEQ